MKEKGQSLVEEKVTNSELKTNISRWKTEVAAKLEKLFPTQSNRGLDAIIKNTSIQSWAKGLLGQEPYTGPAFGFEETQIYNLRTLSLAQREFVAQELTKLVSQAVRDKNKIPYIRKSYQHIAKDIEIVQRAIVQRVHELNDSGAYQPGMQATALEITDMLASMALKPFAPLLPTTAEIVPITFFSHETHIQSVPYCDNVVLIGIRYDQVLEELEKDSNAPPFEILAIPHEIGHYVYQRADIAGIISDVNDALAKEYPSQSVPVKENEPVRFAALSAVLPERYKDWYEEIFSDVCGCIVAGPLVALGLLSILASRTDSENNRSNGMHPTGVLRPYILKAILDELYAIQPQKYPYTAVAAEISSNLGHTLTADQKKEIEAIQKIVRVFATILLKNQLVKEFELWSKQELPNLSQCETALRDIRAWPAFKELKPTELQKSDDSRSKDIGELAAAWQKKGPVTIGDHD